MHAPDRASLPPLYLVLPGLLLNLLGNLTGHTAALRAASRAPEAARSRAAGLTRPPLWLWRGPKQLQRHVETPHESRNRASWAAAPSPAPRDLAHSMNSVSKSAILLTKSPSKTHSVSKLGILLTKSPSKTHSISKTADLLTEFIECARSRCAELVGAAQLARLRLYCGFSTGR